VLYLYIEAPFAACRTFTAGWYRPTATFLTPSAAYGLILNVAAIETRLREEEAGHDGKTPASTTRLALPAVKLAIGAPTDAEPFPRVQSVYQQLHNYPVGSSGAERAESAKGNKYNITPVRREFLTDLRAVICLDGNGDLENRIRRGLRGEFNADRYGLPFLGDNSFLLNRLEELDQMPAAHWYRRITDTGGLPHPRTNRLTVWIDRANSSRTISYLYAPGDATAEIPAAAWTEIKPTS
jgi:CRISPR-associated protein Cas5t